jgi:hypothetical protein
LSRRYIASIMGAPKAPKKIFFGGGPQRMVKNKILLTFWRSSGGLLEAFWRPSKSSPTKFMFNKGGVCEA